MDKTAKELIVEVHKLLYSHIDNYRDFWEWNGQRDEDGFKIKERTTIPWDDEKRLSDTPFYTFTATDGYPSSSTYTWGDIAEALQQVLDSE